MQAFDYIFNVGGDFTAQVNGMSKAMGEFSAKVEGAQGWIIKLHSKLATFDLLSNAAQKTADVFGRFSESGAELDKRMHELSAIAGVTGSTLSEIEGYARSSAKAFGTDAAQAVEGYKLLLSQLTPELGKCPEALKAMGESIQVTSKLMGGDGVAAAEVLTTAMNQYGVSLTDPIKASQTMARMMNVMAAAGQAGSAELPAIKAALQQCGMAAKAANVSFEETNAAIQVLDKAGKKASEGGVALRNTLGTLSQGRFLPKDTQQELAAAGIDVAALGDKSKSLSERLAMLKPLLNDSALFSKLFGIENSNAARALVQNTEQLDAYTEAVTGTNSAQEQAATIMDSYVERQARIKQQIEDVKITLFQATDGFTLWAGAAADGMKTITDLLPVIELLGGGIGKVISLPWSGWLRTARLQMKLLDFSIQNGILRSKGFAANMGRATLAVVRFGTVGLMNGLKALGAYVLSLVTGGTASAGFAATASTAFTAFRTTAVGACRAVGIAIMHIPIVGWIAAAIVAIGALGTYFWNTSVTFRATLKGLWASFKTVFTGIGDLACNTFSAIGDLIKAAFSLDADGIYAAIGKLKGGFSNYGSAIGDAFSKAYAEEMNRGKAATGDTDSEESEPFPSIAAPSGGAVDVTGGLGTGGGESGSRIRNVVISIDKLVDKFEVNTTNLAEGADKVKEAVQMALLSALNDVSLAQGN